MLTIMSQPIGIEFSKNPILFQLTTDNYEINPPQKGGFKLDLGTGLNTGSSITLAFTDLENNQQHTHTITAKSNPNSSGTQIPDNTQMYSYQDYAELAVKLLSNSILLQSYFDITYEISNSTIYIYLLGDNITASNTTYDPRINTIATAAGSTKENFKIIADIYLSGKKLTRLQAIPDSSNAVEFDISSIIDSELETQEPTLPAFGIGEVIDPPRFFIKAMEQQEGAGVDTVVFSSGAKAQYASVEMPRLYIDTPLLLSNKGLYNRTSRTAPMFHSFLNLTGSEQYIKAQFKIIYSDGTTTTWIDASTPFHLLPYQILQYPTGYEELNIEAFEPDKLPILYQVRFANQADTALTDVDTYEIVEPHPLERILLFRNHFGVWETLRTTGRWAKNIKLSRQLATQARAASITEARGKKYQYQAATTNTWRIRTGYLSTSEMQGAADILSSTAVYWVKDTDLIPLLIENKSALTAEDRNYLKALQLEVIEATPVNFTEKVAKNLPEEEGKIKIVASINEITALNP